MKDAWIEIYQISHTTRSMCAEIKNNFSNGFFSSLLIFMKISLTSHKHNRVHDWHKCGHLHGSALTLTFERRQQRIRKRNTHFFLLFPGHYFCHFSLALSHSLSFFALLFRIVIELWVFVVIRLQYKLHRKCDTAAGCVDFDRQYYVFYIKKNLTIMIMQ